MSKEDGLRLPYSQQFSPETTPLKKLLPILRQNAGKASLRTSLASAFFKATKDPEKLAGNTLIALRSFGIIQEKSGLTQFGSELVALQGQDEARAHQLLAQRLLLNLNGIGLVETLREMDRAGLPISLITLPDELEKRGVKVNKSSSDLSGLLGWLRAAKILTDYKVNAQEYQVLVKASSATLDATKDLKPEQVAFLRAMLALNVQEWTPYNVVIEHAEALYHGEIRYNPKDIVKAILRPLETAGFIQIRKKGKEDKSTPEGRGGKAADIKPSKKFDDEFAAPLLEALYRSAGFTQLRKIRSAPLSQIVADLKQTVDQAKRGEALEILAIRLCQMLDLEFMGWRETDVELAGGGEVDAMLHASRLVYSRWQVQCKVGSISLEAVAKEVGMQSVTLANVILLVSTGRATDSAQTYRRKILVSSNLNIIYIEGDDLQRIVEHHSVLLEILRKQAQDALALKPKVSALSDSLPSQEGQSNAQKKSEDDRVIVVENRPEPLPCASYATDMGRMFNSDSLKVLPALISEGVRAKLILTSPPFALVRKKEYGNEDSDSYIQWFEQFIPHFKKILDPQGSLVIDIGGTWIKGIPARSTYQYKLLLRLCESGFYLAQDFYHYNPARLPTPAEWVTIRRLRVKDAVNSVWWLTLDPFVKVDNRRILAPYSDSMKALIKNGYKPAVRPSGHDISDKFQRDNGGSIPPNLLEFANTESNSYYLRRCKEENLKPHPARFPQALPDFFIRFLTEPQDVVLDPFAGSNVTGFAAEKLGRQWISTELRADYVKASKFRFEAESLIPSPKNGKPPRSGTSKQDQLPL